jgi:hypothetical protein
VSQGGSVTVVESVNGKSGVVKLPGLTSEGELPSSVVSGSTGGTSLKGLVPYSQGAGNSIALEPVEINARAFGAVPGTDCSAAILSAIAQLKAEGILNFCIYFPAATEPYKLALGVLGEAVVKKGVCVKLRGDGRLSSWLAPAKSEEPILTIEGPADATNQGLLLEDIGIELTANRRYDKPLFQINFARNFDYSRVAIRGRGATNFTGTIFSHESSYEGKIEIFVGEGSKYILPFVHTNEKEPVNSAGYQTCDNIKFDRCTWTVMGPVFRNSLGSVHNIEWSVSKGAQSVYYSPATIYTQLVKEAKAGETTIEVESAEGLVANDFLMVGHDALGMTGDFVRIASIAGKVITLNELTPLLATHAVGAEITQGGTALVLGDNVVSATLTGPHLEHALAGICLGSTQDVMIINPFSTSAYVVRRCGEDKNTTFISGRMAGTTVANALQSTAADNPASELGETVILGTFSEAPGASHAVTVLPNSATSYTCTYEDTKGSWTIRRNVRALGENAKDRAYEVTRGGATTAKIQYGGRGYFQDGIAIEDLGDITGLTNAEISAKCVVTPSDSTSVGEIIRVAILSGSRVLLQIAAGSSTWYVSNPFSPIGTVAKQRGTLEARGVLLPAAAAGSAMVTTPAALNEANRAFLHRAFAQRAGTLKHIYVWGGATKGGKSRLAVSDAGEAENGHSTVLWESAEVEIAEESKWILMGEPGLTVVENQQFVLGLMNSGTTQLFGKLGSAPTVGAANELPTVFLPDSPGISPKLLAEHKYGSLSFGGVGAKIADENMEIVGTAAAYAILGHIE